MHGSATVAPRPHMPSGTYDADVSPWLLGYIVGRELLPSEVVTTDAAHPDRSRYEGAFLAIHHASPTEAWAVARLDHLVAHERAGFGTSRPVGFLTWSELDPLHHPTEAANSKADRATFDLSTVELVDHPPGVFIPFDAYPYYPHFVNDDRAIERARTRWDRTRTWVICSI